MGLLSSKEETLMKNRKLVYLLAIVLLGISFAGCHPRMDTMNAAEKIFIKMVAKTPREA